MNCLLNWQTNTSNLDGFNIVADITSQGGVNEKVNATHLISPVCFFTISSQIYFWQTVMIKWCTIFKINKLDLLMIEKHALLMLKSLIAYKEVPTLFEQV